MVPELVALARNPIPSGAVTGMLKSFDGAEIRYALWQASREPRVGTVCLFGGRTEFIEKYFEVVADLRRRGFAVATMDWRGQGGSSRLLKEPQKGHVGDFADYLEDLKRFMRDVVLPDCPPPYVALAHSMGGHILLRAASMPGLWFDKIVVSAPMLRLHSSQLGVAPSTALFASKVAKLIGISGATLPKRRPSQGEITPFEDNPFTSDRERYLRNCALLEAAPHLAISWPTWGWLNAALRSMDILGARDYPSTIKSSVLFLVAGEDTVVSSRAIKDFAVSVKLARHIVIPHAKHEILQEQDELRQQFWAAFDAYVGLT